VVIERGEGVFVYDTDGKRYHGLRPSTPRSGHAPFK
jgi:hypothetical protein